MLIHLKNNKLLAILIPIVIIIISITIIFFPKTIFIKEDMSCNCIGLENRESQTCFGILTTCKEIINKHNNESEKTVKCPEASCEELRKIIGVPEIPEDELTDKEIVLLIDSSHSMNENPTNVTTTISNKDQKNILLLIDSSNSMEGEGIKQVKEATANIVSQMTEEENVALVTFSQNATVLTEFTQDKKQLVGAIQGIHAQTTTHYGLGLDKANELFEQNEADQDSSDKREKILILLSDGAPDDRPSEILYKSKEMREGNINIYAIGMGTNVNTTILEQITGDASGKKTFTEVTDLAETLQDVYKIVRGELYDLKTKSIITPFYNNLLIETTFLTEDESVLKNKHENGDSCVVLPTPIVETTIINNKTMMVSDRKLSFSNATFNSVVNYIPKGNYSLHIKSEYENCDIKSNQKTTFEVTENIPECTSLDCDEMMKLMNFQEKTIVRESKKSKKFIFIIDNSASMIPFIENAKEDIKKIVKRALINDGFAVFRASFPKEIEYHYDLPSINEELNEAVNKDYISMIPILQIIPPNEELETIPDIVIFGDGNIADYNKLSNELDNLRGKCVHYVSYGTDILRDKEKQKQIKSLTGTCGNIYITGINEEEIIEILELKEENSTNKELSIGVRDIENYLQIETYSSFNKAKFPMIITSGNKTCIATPKITINSEFNETFNLTFTNEGYVIEKPKNNPIAITSKISQCEFNGDFTYGKVPEERININSIVLGILGIFVFLIGLFTITIIKK